MIKLMKMNIVCRKNLEESQNKHIRLLDQNIRHVYHESIPMETKSYVRVCPHIDEGRSAPPPPAP